MPKIMSLFDGSGGFPLAASMFGITPTYASEVEPYPIAVTKSRFPNMIHLGSVTDVNGGNVDPVDVVTFGSPCQDLSVAGKRAGLKHEANGDDETTRSGLFMEAVRIIKEMREATNGLYPAFAVWENVPGAFSSNGGEDFRTVLEELIRIVEPTAVMPSVPKGGWAYADVYCGTGWSLAYRVLDAQFWGVPQRRRRIYLVLDLRGERAGEILFKRGCLSRHTQESGTPWETTAGNAEDCAGAADRAKCFGISSYASNAMKSSNPHSGIYEATTSRTLDLNGGNPACNQGGIMVVERHLFENHSQDTRYKGPLDVSPMLSAQLGTGGNNTPFVVEKHPVWCLQGSMIGRSDKNGPQGDGINEEVCFTCNTIDRHAVAYLASGKDTVAALMANAGSKLWLGNQEAFSGDYHIIEERGEPIEYIVRRLTPTECARLQGFPDKWGHPDHKDNFADDEYAFWLNVRNTHAAINGKAVKDYTKDQMLTWYNKLHTDSAEYKLWGNGIALPCALYVMEGIAKCLSTEK